MAHMSGLKKIRLIGDLIRTATDGEKNSLTIDDIHKIAWEEGLKMETPEIDAILAFLILNDRQIQQVDNRFFHQRHSYLSPASRSHHFYK